MLAYREWAGFSEGQGYHCEGEAQWVKRCDSQTIETLPGAIDSHFYYSVLSDFISLLPSPHIARMGFFCSSLHSFMLVGMLLVSIDLRMHTLLWRNTIIIRHPPTTWISSFFLLVGD